MRDYSCLNSLTIQTHKLCRHVKIKIIITLLKCSNKARVKTVNDACHKILWNSPILYIKNILKMEAKVVIDRLFLLAHYYILNEIKSNQKQ